MTTAVATFERDLPVTTTPAIRELTVEEIDWVSGASAGDAAAAAATTGFFLTGGFVARAAIRAGATIGRALLVGAAAGTGVGLVAAVLATAVFIGAEYVASRVLDSNA